MVVGAIVQEIHRPVARSERLRKLRALDGTRSLLQLSLIIAYLLSVV